MSGGHVPEPTPLADVLEVLDAERFRLLGRSNDLINVAGKRSSLGHLNFHLNAIDGVRRRRVLAARRAPPTPPASCAWSPSSSRRRCGREQIVAALRERVDAAFLPRRVVHGRRAAARADRQADRGAARRARGRARRRPRSPLRHEAMDAQVTRALEIAVDHPAFAGHFPGQPLLPGVALLAEVLEAALAEPALAAAIGPAPRLAVVKFLAPVGPGAALEIALRLERADGRVSASTAAAGRSPPASSPAPTSTRRRRDEERRQRRAAAASWAAPARAQQPAGGCALMRWIALAAGRRVARLLLHPIALYFLLVERRAARAIRARYLDARARPAGDLARRLPPHPHLLRDRARPRLPPAGALRRVRVRGAAASRRSSSRSARGEGVLACRRAPRQLRGAAHGRPRARACAWRWSCTRTTRG